MAILQKEVYLTPSEVKSKIREFIASNAILETQGKLKNAINLIGQPGIAKTSSVLQVCAEDGIGVEKVNMANIDDLGEITGFPLKEYELDNGKEKVWVNEKSFDIHVSSGYTPTGSTRTGYAEPKWVSRLKDYKTSVLLLDDSLRSHQRFVNALMELICRGEYYGWKLPSGCNIVMTNNPSDGEYQVAQVDSAQSSRYFNFWVKYDKKDWAEQAEKEQVPGPFINFILKESDQIFDYIDHSDRLKGMRSMPRQWSMLFNSLMNLSGNFTNPKALLQIQQNGKAMLPEELVNSFVTFLQTKDWDMIEPETIFNSKDEKELLEKLKHCVGDYINTSFKSPQAAILSLRVINYLSAITIDKPFTTEMCKRLQFLMENKIFGKDLNFKVIRDLGGKDPKKFVKLFENPFFQKESLS